MNLHVEKASVRLIIRQFRELHLPLSFLLSFAISLTAAFWVYNTHVQTTHLPTIDLGQWLMYSRFYRGESVPAYRTPLTVSPFVPLSLASLSPLVGGVQAVNYLSAVLIFLLGLSSAYLAFQLGRTPIAAPLATFLVTFGQPIVIEVSSFGGLPQLGALVSMNIGLSGMILTLENIQSRKGWVVLTIATYSTILFHIPSAPLFFLILGMPLMGFAIYHRIYLYRAIQYLGLPLFGFVLYVLLFYEAQQSYATNRAAWYRRGPDDMTGYLTLDPWLSALISIAFLSWVLQTSILFKNASVPTRKRQLLLITWFVVPAVFMMGHALGIGTDYHRLILYLVLPLLLSLALTVGQWVRHCSKFATSVERSIVGKFTSIIVRSFSIVGVIGIGLILFQSLRFSFEYYPQAVRYYSSPNSSSLLDAIKWLELQPNTRTVYMPSLSEANWVEGLTGRATLFSNKLRFLYRPGEVDRVIAADVVATATGTVLENGWVLGQVLLDAYGAPRNLFISVAHQGEYTAATLLRDDAIEVITVQGNSVRNINFSRTFVLDGNPLIIRDEDTVRVVHRYRAWLATVPWWAQKTITMSNDTAEITLDLTIHSAQGITLHAINLHFCEPTLSAEDRTVNPSELIHVVKRGNVLQFEHQDSSLVPFSWTLTTSPAPIWRTPHTLENSAANPWASCFLQVPAFQDTTVRAQFVFSSVPDSRIREGVFIRTLAAVTQQYNVGYVVLRYTDTQLRALYEHYGYIRRFENWHYVIYQVP